MNTETKSMTAGEIREHLVSRASSDDEFRGRLQADPKATIKAELGITLPEQFTIQVHEEGAETAHLVLPPNAGLSEGELQQAAGGNNEPYFWHSPLDTTGKKGVSL